MQYGPSLKKDYRMRRKKVEPPKSPLRKTIPVFCLVTYFSKAIASMAIKKSYSPLEFHNRKFWSKERRLPSQPSQQKSNIRKHTRYITIHRVNHPASRTTFHQCFLVFVTETKGIIKGHGGRMIFKARI